MPDPIITALRERAERAEAEVERLKAGGCARDQTTTQYCAEAVEAIARAKRAERELASIHAEAASALGWALNMAAARVADGCALRAVQHALGEWQGEKGRCRSERERAGRAERELAEAGLRGSPPPGRSMVDRMQQAEAAIEACAPHLKDGETPADCIARNRADVDAALALLAKRTEERDEARAERAREARDRQTAGDAWNDMRHGPPTKHSVRRSRDMLTNEERAEVARRVMGLQVAWLKSGGGRPAYAVCATPSEAAELSTDYWPLVPKYDTDANDRDAVVEAMRAKGYGVAIIADPDEPASVTIGKYTWADRDSAEYQDDSLGTAVCRAALAALDAEEGR